MTRTMTWTDSRGVATVLDGSAGILLLDDPVGLEAPNPSNTIDDYIGFDGGVLINRRHTVRSIALALFLEHPTRVTSVVEQAALMFRGPGSIEWSDDVNIRRLRQVIYEAGLDGSGNGNVWERSVVVSLIALDPWWYGLGQVYLLQVLTPTPFDGPLGFNAARSFDGGTTARTAFDAPIGFDEFLPFDGGVMTVITVPGDTDAYPVVTVTGPAGTLTVGSHDGVWTIAAPLGPADVLTVDARPGHRGPTLNGGPVNWALLSPGSQLFTVGPGPTELISGAAGSTGATSITLTCEPRYLTP